MSHVDSVSGQIFIDYEAIHDSILTEIKPGYREEWYEEQIDMLFIVPNGYEQVVANLSMWKTQKGVPNKIINQSVYTQYSGRDKAEQLRNCIKDYYEKYGIKWVLLVGDTDLIPIRYVYNPDTRVLREQGSTYYESLGADDIYKPTDYYYADLTGTWDEDGDGIYGEGLLENRKEEISWIPEVNVGRFPGNSIEEIERMINKSLYYETAQNPGEWMNQMLLGAAIQDMPTASDLDGEQEVWLANRIIEESINGNINFTLLAESTQWGTNLSLSSFSNEINSGQSIILFAGHGSPTSFNGVGTTIFTSSAATNLVNFDMPSLVFADACSTNMFDPPAGDNSLGEAFIKKDRGGAIGYIGGMRLSYYYENDSYSTCDLCELNRGMTRLFFQEFFLNNHTKQGEALNEMRISYLNSVWLKNNPEWGNSYNIHEIEWERKNVLTYNLLGDPEVDIFTQNPKKFGNQTFGLIPWFNEGSTFEQVIRDEHDNPVPNAKINLIGDDGAYETYFTDQNGLVRIQLPFGVQDYDYTITKHNMIPTMGMLHIVNDTEAPIFTQMYSYSPGKPTVNDEIRFIIPSQDANSSISCGVIVVSKDPFQNYLLYGLSYDEDAQRVDGVLPQLTPGNYFYILFIYDFGENYSYLSWANTMAFKIPVSASFILILTLNIGLLGLMGYLIFKKYKANS